MLDKADREITEVALRLSSRGLDAGYLVPTETGLEKSIMDAHAQLSGFLRRTGLHDYSQQPKGTDSKVLVKTQFVKHDRLVETKTSLYRPETKMGDPRLWIYDLGKHAKAGNLLALLVHEGVLYVVNTSETGILESAGDPSSPLSLVFDLVASTKSKPLDDRFSEWNLRLLRSFFSEASKGEEVFLRVDKELLDQIGQDIGGDKGFLEAVRLGPAWAKPKTSILERALLLLRQRENQTSLRQVSYKDPGDFDLTYRGHLAPTYLPYLAALVRNDIEHPQNYYPGLRDDLRLKHTFGSTEMERMEQVWGDLQEWTKQRKGQFGYFKLRVLGGYSRIGVPRSQSILHQGDIAGLSRAFVQAEIRPGHALSETEVSSILGEARAHGHYFSVAFRNALDEVAFESPIRAAIASAYADWDGTIPARHISGPEAVVEKQKIGLCLTIIEHEPLTLAPHWWIPPLQDAGHFKLRHVQSNTAWDGNFAGTEGSTNIYASDNCDPIWKIVEQAYNGDIEFKIENFPSGDQSSIEVELLLPRRQLWILAPSFNATSGGIELREADLPGNGPAYLLSPPENLARLKGYLDREQPEYSIIDAAGLPADWLLICLKECATLHNEQRLLPDGEEGPHPRPRAIRIIGGRSINRGYSRMYLPYDLPSIELDAPDGAQLNSPRGLGLVEELTRHHPNTPDDGQFKPRKRFRIELKSFNSASYEIQAVLGGEILGQAKLRIAGLSGELVDTSQSFSVDSIGRPMASREGLSGVLPPTVQDELPITLDCGDLFELPPSSFGIPACLNSPTAGAYEQFLDSLAQLGSIDYGTARSQILRLWQDVGEAIEPPLVLLELRSRGHLEISTTHKGHISRVHAVEPTVYELPITASGKRLYGVTGTLRLSHWERIAERSSTWSAFRAKGGDHVLKPLRLFADTRESVQARCKQLGLSFSNDPAIAIAEWSSDINRVRNEIFRNPMESIGRAQDSAMRFNAAKGIFTANPVGDEFTELWKIRDLDTRIDNVYVLYDHRRFAFIRDSRWGIWIALDAFAEWAGKLPGMHGVYPIPLTYSRQDGTLWLPARISLPFVLERALVLCSGDAPEMQRITHKEDDATTGRIILSVHEGWRPILTTNRFYNDLAIGKWLAYRWVPENIASIVAGKLGACLDFT